MEHIHLNKGCSFAVILLEESITDTSKENCASTLLDKRTIHRIVKKFCVDMMSTGQKKVVAAEKLDDVGAN